MLDVFFRTRIFRLEQEERGAWGRALSARSAQGAMGYLALESAWHAIGIRAIGVRGFVNTDRLVAAYSGAWFERSQ